MLRACTTNRESWPGTSDRGGSRSVAPNAPLEPSSGTRKPPESPRQRNETPPEAAGQATPCTDGRGAEDEKTDTAEETGTTEPAKLLPVMTTSRGHRVQLIPSPAKPTGQGAHWKAAALGMPA